MPHKGQISIKVSNENGLPLLKTASNALFTSSGTSSFAYFSYDPEHKNMELESGILNPGTYYLKLVGNSIGNYKVQISYD